MTGEPLRFNWNCGWSCGCFDRNPFALDDGESYQLRIVTSEPQGSGLRDIPD